MHHLGFEVLNNKKEAYVDGHEREDVVRCLWRMITLGFITKEESPSGDIKSKFPNDIPSPSRDTIEKTVFIFDH